MSFRLLIIENSKLNFVELLFIGLMPIYMNTAAIWQQFNN